VRLFYNSESLRTIVSIAGNSIFQKGYLHVTITDTFLLFKNSLVIVLSIVQTF